MFFVFQSHMSFGVVSILATTSVPSVLCFHPPASPPHLPGGDARRSVLPTNRTNTACRRQHATPPHASANDKKQMAQTFHHNVVCNTRVQLVMIANSNVSVNTQHNQERHCPSPENLRKKTSPTRPRHTQNNVALAHTTRCLIKRSSSPLRFAADGDDQKLSSTD